MTTRYLLFISMAIIFLLNIVGCTVQKKKHFNFRIFIDITKRGYTYVPLSGNISGHKYFKFW
jgi:hypothetical protein